MTALVAAGQTIRRLISDTRGGSLIEYAAITFVVSIAIGFVLPSLGDSLKQLYSQTFAVMERIVPDTNGRQSDDTHHSRDNREDDHRDGRHDRNRD